MMIWKTKVWRGQKQIQSFMSLNSERPATLLSTANPEKWTDFHYTRWVQKVGGIDMKDALYKATEDELDDLYILREELRLGI